MNANIKVLIYSIIFGVAHVTYMFFRPKCEGEGFGCLANDMGPILLGILVAPIIFGILGFALSKEKRFKQAISWFGISFAVFFALNFIGGQLHKAAFPKDRSQNYAPCLPDYVGDSTCEEWQKTYPELQRKKL